MNDVKRGADFYDLGKYNNRLNKNTPPPKDRTPEFGKQVFDETDTPKTKIILDTSFPPKNNAPEFDSKKFDLSDAEEHAVDDSMIISEKRLPPTPPQKVTESMIISEKRLPPRSPQKVNETMIISEKKLPPPPPKKGSRPELAPEAIATMNDSYEVVDKDEEIELGDQDMEEVSIQSKKLNAPPKHASPPEFKHLIKDKNDTANPQNSTDLAHEEYHSYEIVAGENTDDAEIELNDDDLKEVSVQSKNLNAQPKPTSPPEFKPSSAETRRSRSDRKTISLASSAGLGRRIRVKINDYYPLRKETTDDEWFEEGNNMSAEKPVQPPEKTPSPSIWQRMKNIFGSRRGK